ncbi:MAG TPA: hypothetical protein VMN39_03805, partial [Longimicrobiaceae bacterium]|nr:hypothetical protein [Longimicrobiaceae bacterium]
MGNNPVWSRSGLELFLRNNQGELEALRVRLDPTFDVVAGEILFSLGSLGQFSGRFHPGPGDSVFSARQAGGPRPNTRLVLVRTGSANSKPAPRRHVGDSGGRTPNARHSANSARCGSWPGVVVRRRRLTRHGGQGRPGTPTSIFTIPGPGGVGAAGSSRN